MTRNDIEKSLKPIEWCYKHKYGTYRATFGVGVKIFEFEISPTFGLPDYKYLVIYLNGKMIDGYRANHESLDSAMREVRRYLLNEVCTLFELDEQ